MDWRGEAGSLASFVIAEQGLAGAGGSRIAAWSTLAGMPLRLLAHPSPALPSAEDATHEADCVTLAVRAALLLREGRRGT